MKFKIFFSTRLGIEPTISLQWLPFII